LKIHEVNEATTLIMEAAHEDAEIIFGTVIDESMKDAVKVTVIATGLGGQGAQLQKPDSVLVQVPAEPPQPRPEMLAPQPQPQPQPVPAPMSEVPEVNMVAEVFSAVEVAPEPEAQPGLSANAAAGDGTELARARAIAQRLGITNLTDDEYDIPTYMRRQQDREI
jgi:cell division protein FtsZ